MAVAVTFAFTVPCLSTKQMQREKFGEAHTWVLESFIGAARKGEFGRRASAGIWETDRSSTGAQVLE